MQEDLTYITLMSSLPRPEAVFLAKRPPISRSKLEERLKALSDDDRARLASIEAHIGWQGLALELDIDGYLKSIKKLMACLGPGTLSTLLQKRLELRTVLAALRLRSMGQANPPKGAWGYGRFVQTIERSWQQRDFGLGHVYPWLKEAADAMAEDDTPTVERLVIEACLTDLNRLGHAHEFDFEAVVIYVLKLNLIKRAAMKNTEGALLAFDTLKSSALKGWQAEALTWQSGA